MKVQKLQIDQQMIQIRADTQLAALAIDMPRRQMKVKRQDASITVNKERPDIELDMQDFRNEHGIRDNSSLMEENAARAYEQVSQSIKETASDGDYVATLPSSGNNIAQLAKNKMLEVEMPELNSGKVPYGPVKMKGDPGSLSINWSSYDLKIEWDEYQSPQITVEPKASVDIRVLQEPFIEISVVEQMIPPEKGVAIDAEA